MTLPSPVMPETQPLSAHARSLLSGLSAQESLRPSPAVNSLFGGLVGMALTKVQAGPARKVLAELKQDGTLPSLHKLCAQGEFEMEAYWGDKIRTSATPMATLREFPYWANYVKLVKLEMAAMRAVHPGFTRVLFVGAGPLPLTAFIMAKHYGVDVTNLEVDNDAAECALEWMGRIFNVGYSVPCLHMDVMDYTDFADYDIVVLAALVGLDQQEKHRVLSHLHRHMTPQQTLMVRSVKGLRGLLYPEVTAADLPGFEVVKTVHPRGDVVNSVILARKLGGA